MNESSTWADAGAGPGAINSPGAGASAGTGPDLLKNRFPIVLMSAAAPHSLRRIPPRTSPSALNARGC